MLIFDFRNASEQRLLAIRHNTYPDWYTLPWIMFVKAVCNDTQVLYGSFGTHRQLLDLLSCTTIGDETSSEHDGG
ncbi:MAG TPA: hypothetical protein VFP40_16105 [Terriglobales bacterium]|nr:hypothetical protein [Terriglobales bacterium]